MAASCRPEIQEVHLSEKKKKEITMPSIPEDYFKLKNLCYGHPGKFILSLKGRFDPLKMSKTQPIQHERICTENIRSIIQV